MRGIRSSPLVWKEFGNSAHFDVLCLGLVCAAWLCRLRGRVRGLGLLLGLAVLVKAYPLCLLPFLVQGLRRREQVQTLVYFGLTLLLGYLPFASAGWGLFRGLGTFASQWQFNAPLLEGLKWLTGESWRSPGNWARYLAGLTLILTCLARYRWRCRQPAAIDAYQLGQQTASDGIFTLGSLMLLSPVADPWYFTWLLPFLVIRPSPPWLVLCGTVSASYLFYLEEVESWSQLTLVYLPFAALWLWNRRPSAFLT